MTHPRTFPGTNEAMMKFPNAVAFPGSADHPGQTIVYVDRSCQEVVAVFSDPQDAVDYVVWQASAPDHFRGVTKMISDMQPQGVTS